MIKIKQEGRHSLEILKQLSDRAVIEHCTMVYSFLDKAYEVQRS